MRKSVIVVALALGAVISVVAQDTAPLRSVASLNGNFRALAVTSNGERLMAVNAEDNQALVYRFDDPSNPRLLNSVDLDGEPVAVAAAEDFGLVAVHADSAGLLQIIAIPSYAPRQGYINYGTYDVTSNPEGLSLSPSAHWGIVYGQNGYTLLELLSADEINSATTEGRSILGAALTDSALLLLPAERAVVEIATLQAGPQQDRASELALDAPAMAVATNADGTLAAVLLENNTVLLLDPSAAEAVGSVRLRGQFSQLRFLNHDEVGWLVLVQPGESSLLVLDVSNPARISQVGALELPAPMQAFAVFDDLLVASSSRTATVFAPR